MAQPSRRPQDLVFTLYGEYLLGREDAPWVGAIIALLHPFGLSEGAVRTVLSRMARKGWLETHLGAGARIEQAAEGAASVGRFVGDLPKLLRQAERTADSFGAMAEDGLRLDEESVARIAQAQSSQDRWTRLGIWVGALALLAIAVAQIL